MSKLSEHFYAVILAGGGGTRLWPKSTKKHPKHLLKLFGEQTLLQLTYSRIENVIPDKKIFVITFKDHAKEVMEQLPKIPKENFIVEPQAKNTALAMGTAAAYIGAKDPEGVIINLAADQIHKDIKRFQETALAALEAASQGDYIVAIGIKPTFAHTGLGYIRIGDQLGEIKIYSKDIYAFKSKGFKEKPDLVTAQEFLASEQYLWNANLYCWSIKTIFSAFEKHHPQIYKFISQIKDAVDSFKEKEVLESVYDQAENIQIDYAVSEKASNIVVIPGDFGWSDVGDWQVVYDLSQKDASGIVNSNKNTELINIGSKNCLVEANGKLIVTIGLEDVVIVDTGNVLLVCKKENSQDVKKAVEKLKEEGKDKFL